VLTCFANAEGGVVVFGVTDSVRRMPTLSAKPTALVFKKKILAGQPKSFLL
jgi:hypothetical protein